MKIGFLCYSKYVVFVSYVIKNIYHSQDECILVLSDDAKQFDEKFVSNIKTSDIWSDVITIHEYNQKVEEIEHQMNAVLDQSIKCFYVANIMRCSSHYLTNRIETDSELIIMDEGSSTLNLMDEYKFWLRKGLPLQWKEFNFERINKMRVFFPEITKNPMNVPIEFINLEQLFAIKPPQEIAGEMNAMFGYQYKKLERDIILMDTHISKTHEYSMEFENYCANQLLSISDPGKMIIKSAPSDPMEYVLEKYHSDEICVYIEKDIPFEVIYLNYIVNNNLPKMIISMPSTLIWNINMIHQTLKIKNVTMVSLVGIIKDFNCIPHRKKKFWEEQLFYNSVFKEEYKVQMPCEWHAISQILQLCCPQKGIKTEWNLLKEENKFLKRNYVELLEKRNEQSDLTQLSLKKQNAYTDILSKILYLKGRGTDISQILEELQIDEVIIYGTGVTGKILYEDIKESRIVTSCFVQTEKGDCGTIDDKIVFGVSELKEFINNSAVIIVTMPFLLEEIKNILLEKKITNRVISLFDIINDRMKKKY